MLKGFREFILRGNVVDLAVAVVIGTAFGLVIAAFVRDLITPLVAALFGKPDFSGLTFTINNSTFRYGDFINAVIAFFLVAAAIYFVVVAPMNHIAERRARKTEATHRECPHCLTEIPSKATRCSACTSDLPAAA
ncbi:MAG TPA: large conductance mechanosensitive channel protein MscL [Candidatus Dormibacteraeota bacterium]